jgi:hypothetical protein
MNIYDGMLLVPVRVQADSPVEGLQVLQRESTRITGMLRYGGTTWRDTYRQTQASIEMKPVVEGVLCMDQVREAGL